MSYRRGVTGGDSGQGGEKGMLLKPQPQDGGSKDTAAQERRKGINREEKRH